MKISDYFLAVCIVVAAVLSAGCTSSFPGGITPAMTLTVAATTAGTTPSCGFTSCHGLDLACGENPPEVCTALYQLGDKCRQLAFCSNANGTCQLVPSQAFESCKACVEKCGGADPAEIFSCEEKC